MPASPVRAPDLNPYCGPPRALSYLLPASIRYWLGSGQGPRGSAQAEAYAAELWRIKGELLVGKARAGGKKKGAATDSVLDTARRCLERSLKIARRQEAKSLELRSLMSLARVPQKRDNSFRTHAPLRSLLASFTEGFDTKDLRDAQTLLGTSLDSASSSER